MKMTNALTVSGGMILLVALSVLLATQLCRNNALRQDKEQLAGAMQLLEQRLAALALTVTELTVKLAETDAAARAAAATASNAAAKLAADEAAKAPSSAPTPAVPQPYQVPVYLGQKSLGLAWAVPRRIKQDPQSGRVSYEQYISLPETARELLAVYVTNVVEQPVLAPPQVIQHNVYVNRTYAWAYAPYQRDGPIAPGFGKPAPVPQPAPPSSPAIYTPPRPGDPGIYVPPGIR